MLLPSAGRLVLMLPSWESGRLEISSGYTRLEEYSELESPPRTHMTPECHAADE